MPRTAHRDLRTSVSLQAIADFVEQTSLPQEIERPPKTPSVETKVFSSHKVPPIDASCRRSQNTPFSSTNPESEMRQKSSERGQVAVLPKAESSTSAKRALLSQRRPLHTTHYSLREYTLTKKQIMGEAKICGLDPTLDECTLHRPSLARVIRPTNQQANE
ncbi:hypothetical protein EVAR_32986_1 [Eumeta japonica]|uniref:Uncharacterized protein n=1 Tax=Eumeta variegata TaxID=151549 RepID=A0A4C1VRV0_EUMVA|nr:hypothetical protein EVAR_32986_1 [Eumeta japonica]